MNYNEFGLMFCSVPIRNPNAPEDDFNGPEWPLYTDTGQEFLTLDEDLGKDIRKVGRGPRADKCAFWNQYLPKLETQTGKLMGELL